MKSYSIPGVGSIAPMKDAPHQDVGKIVNGLSRTAESIVAKVSDVLQMPLDATVKIEGPHKMVENAIDEVGGRFRNIVGTVTR